MAAYSRRLIYWGGGEGWQWASQGVLSVPNESAAAWGQAVSLSGQSDCFAPINLPIERGGVVGILVVPFLSLTHDICGAPGWFTQQSLFFSGTKFVATTLTKYVPDIWLFPSHGNSNRDNPQEIGKRSSFPITAMRRLFVRDGSPRHPRALPQSPRCGVADPLPRLEPAAGQVHSESRCPVLPNLFQEKFSKSGLVYYSSYSKIYLQ